MAIRLHSSSFEYLSTSWNDVSAAPITFAIWYNPASAATANLIIVHDSVSGDYIRLRGLNTGFLEFTVRSGSTTKTATTPNRITSLNGWHLAVGSMRSDGLIAVRLDGGAFATATGAVFPTALTSMILGREHLVFSGFFDGRLAEAAIWAKELTVAEADTLYSNQLGPMNVHPDELVFYAPLLTAGSSRDYFGGHTLTENGAGISSYAHPRIVQNYHPVLAHLPHILATSTAISDLASVAATGGVRVQAQSSATGASADSGALGAVRIVGQSTATGQGASVSSTASIDVIGSAVCAGSGAIVAATGAAMMTGTVIALGVGAQGSGQGEVHVAGSAGLAGEAATVATTGAVRVVGTADALGDPATVVSTGGTGTPDSSTGTATCVGEQATVDASAQALVLIDAVAVVGSQATSALIGRVGVAGSGAFAGQGASFDASGTVRTLGSVIAVGAGASAATSAQALVDGRVEGVGSGAVLASIGHVRVNGSGLLNGAGAQSVASSAVRVSGAVAAVGTNAVVEARPADRVRQILHARRWVLPQTGRAVA